MDVQQADAHEDRRIATKARPHRDLGCPCYPRHTVADVLQIEPLDDRFAHVTLDQIGLDHPEGEPLVDWPGNRSTVGLPADVSWATPLPHQNTNLMGYVVLALMRRSRR